MSDPTLAEKVDALLALSAKVDAEIIAILREMNGEPPKRRSRYVIPECGTESAFQRHHYYGEDIDEACREAHRLHERVRYARTYYRTTEAS